MKPDDGRDHIDSGQTSFGALIVAGGCRAILLALCEEIFAQVLGFVARLLLRPLDFPGGLWRHAGDFVSARQWPEASRIRLPGCLGNPQLCGNRWPQPICSSQITDLACCRPQVWRVFAFTPKSRAVWAIDCSDSTASLTARSFNAVGYFCVGGWRIAHPSSAASFPCLRVSGRV